MNEATPNEAAPPRTIPAVAVCVGLVLALGLFCESFFAAPGQCVSLMLRDLETGESHDWPLIFALAEFAAGSLLAATVLVFMFKLDTKCGCLLLAVGITSVLISLLLAFHGGWNAAMIVAK